MGTRIFTLCEPKPDPSINSHLLGLECKCSLPHQLLQNTRVCSHLQIRNWKLSDNEYYAKMWVDVLPAITDLSPALEHVLACTFLHHTPANDDNMDIFEIYS